MNMITKKKKKKKTKNLFLHEQQVYRMSEHHCSSQCEHPYQRGGDHSSSQPYRMSEPRLSSLKRFMFFQYRKRIQGKKPLTLCRNHRKDFCCWCWEVLCDCRWGKRGKLVSDVQPPNFVGFIYLLVWKTIQQTKDTQHTRHVNIASWDASITRLCTCLHASSIGLHRVIFEILRG